MTAAKTQSRVRSARPLSNMSCDESEWTGARLSMNWASVAASPGVHVAATSGAALWGTSSVSIKSHHAAAVRKPVAHGTSFV